MNKVLSSADEAVALIPDGATIMMGGFGLCGIPENLIAALRDRGTRNLTDHQQQRRRRRVRDRHPADDAAGAEDDLDLRRREPEFERQCLSGELDLELVPQGTFAERIRAGGAGIGGFFTPTGYGTIVAEGKETRLIDGRHYVLEAPLKADFAFVKAFRGDTLGNLVYRRTARNFNPMMATAAAGHHRGGRRAGRARARSTRSPWSHAGHLREVHPPGTGLREAHRASHGADAGAGRMERASGGAGIGDLAWTSATGSSDAWPGNCGTAITSISVSGCRRSWPTSCRPASTSRCTRRTACSASGRSRSRPTSIRT